MTELILIKQVTERRADVYVLRAPTAKTILNGRYVTTTRYPKSAKRYKSIEAANQEIARFKKLNFLTAWEVVVIVRDLERFPASV